MKINVNFTDFGLYLPRAAHKRSKFKPAITFLFNYQELNLMLFSCYLFYKFTS